MGGTLAVARRSGEDPDRPLDHLALAGIAEPAGRLLQRDPPRLGDLVVVVVRRAVHEVAQEEADGLAHAPPGAAVPVGHRPQLRAHDGVEAGLLAHLPPGRRLWRLVAVRAPLGQGDRRPLAARHDGDDLRRAVGHVAADDDAAEGELAQRLAAVLAPGTAGVLRRHIAAGRPGRAPRACRAPA